MGLVSSGTAKGEQPIMPAVREASPDEAPVKLERVEVSPGNFIKMSATDKAAWEQHNADAEASRQAWTRTTAGIVDEAPTQDAATVLAEHLSKDELVTIAEGRELATSGSKAKIASRIVGGADADPEPEDADPDGTATSTEPEGESA